MIVEKIIEKVVEVEKLVYEEKIIEKIVEVPENLNSKNFKASALVHFFLNFFFSLNDFFFPI
jgi:hypothetical protein